MKDLPDVDVREIWSETLIESSWYPDPNDPRIRWRVSARLWQTIRWREMLFEQAVRSSVQITARRQEKGLFGLWLEDPLGKTSYFDERRVAEALEEEIVAAAVSDGGRE